MWANNCPAGLLKNKKLDIFVPGFARHFLFRAGKQCELTINFDGGVSDIRSLRRCTRSITRGS